MKAHCLYCQEEMKSAISTVDLRTRVFYCKPCDYFVLEEDISKLETVDIDYIEKHKILLGYDENKDNRDRMLNPVFPKL